MKRMLIAVSVTLFAATSAWAQVGVVNPNVPVTITVPPPAGSPPGTPPTTRPSVPFTTDPNQLNNPYPTLLNAGVSGTGGWGVPIRNIYMPAQAVPIVVFDRYMEAAGEAWGTQYAEVPGYVVIETTLGYLYPERWTLLSLAKGVYQWQRVPSVFQPK
jgi:hypothetical protein